MGLLKRDMPHLLTARLFLPSEPNNVSSLSADKALLPSNHSGSTIAAIILRDNPDIPLFVVRNDSGEWLSTRRTRGYGELTIQSLNFLLCPKESNWVMHKSSTSTAYNKIRKWGEISLFLYEVTRACNTYRMIWNQITTISVVISCSISI